ncbi:MAG: hypothetical protein IPO91_03415 [Chloroflexi bacterium]|nr:hypothetical protein [Chloroflexota bacterium]
MIQINSLEPQLEQVKLYLAEDKTAEALEELNRILEAHDSVDAHLLRLSVLLPDLRQPELIQESLVTLSSIDNDVYKTTRETVEEHLHAKLDEIKHQLGQCRTRAEVVEPLRKLNELVILGSYFPIVFFTQGIAYLEARKLHPTNSGAENTSPFQILRSALKVTPSAPPNRDIVEPVKDDQYVEWTECAIGGLNAALHHLEDTNAFVGEIYELMGEIYEEKEEPLIAFALYQKAVEHGRAIDHVLERLHTTLSHQVQEKLVARIDSLIRQQDFDQAARLIADYAPETLSEGWRLRLAEIALLQGDIEQAYHYYKQLLPFDEAAGQEEQDG